MLVGAEVGLKAAEKNEQSLASDAGIAKIKQEAKQEAREKVEADIGYDRDRGSCVVRGMLPGTRL